MADIDILVDSSQVKTAKQELQELSNSFNSAFKSASVFTQAFREAAAQSAADARIFRDIARANQDIINANLKVSNSYKSAEDSAEAFTEGLREQEAQALRTARANQDAINKQLGISGPTAMSSGAGFGALEAEALRLETMYNKVALAARVYEQAQDSLNRASMMGIITADQAEAKLAEMSVAYLKVGDSADKAQAFINRFGENAQVSGRGLNQFGMYAQQVGYQVGDFFVQIQSGTNVLVAFGQQFTQLAGLIPGVFGAVLGIGVSSLTALGAAFMRTGENAQSLSQSMTDLENSIRNVAEATNVYSSEGVQQLLDKYGQLDQQVLSLVANQTAYANLLASKDLKDGLAAIQETIGSDWWQLGISDYAGSLVNLQSMFKMTANDARSLKAAFDEVAKAKTYDEQAAALTKVSNYLRIVISSQEQVTDEQLAIYDAVLKSLDAVKQLSVTQPKQGWLSAAISQAQTLASSLWDAAKARTAAVPESTGLGVTTGNLNWAQTNLGFTLKGDELLGLPKSFEGGSGGGSGGGAGDARLNSLIESLRIERETVTAWYEESKALLQSASDSELEILGGKYEAMARLDAEYRQKTFEAQQAQAQMSFQAYSGMFSALSDLLNTFGNQSKGAAVAALVIQKGLAIAQIVTSTAAAQMRAYAELGPIAGAAMAAKIGFLGKLQMGIVAATGIAQAGSIISGGGSSSAGGSRGSATVASSGGAAPTPQTVYIDSLDPSAMYSGQSLIDLFEAFYNENDRRGKVFVVAR